MNTRIALSGLSIVASLALVTTGAYAYFSNSGTSTGNTFSSGTLDLVLSDANETDQDNVTASFGGSNLAPGDCLSPATLNLKNTGSVAGNHVDVSATNTDTTFASYLKLDTLTYDGSDVTITDSNGNGIRDLQDLAINGIVNKPLTILSTNYPLVMKVCLNTTTPTTQQGKTDTLDLNVLLDQGPHT